MNYYVLLGVPQDADAETIRSAFRALARRYHPDAGEGSSAARFREILTAYETLNDPTLRSHHDRILENRRIPISQFVEPLRAYAAPEPMLRSRSGTMHTNRVYERFGPTRLDELIDELFGSWDELFFGIPRRSTACERTALSQFAVGAPPFESRRSHGYCPLGSIW